MKHHCKGDIKSHKSKGWNNNLYRDKNKAYLGGVCAGLAKNFEVEPWVVRLATIASFLFLNSVTIIIYIALWWLLDPEPEEENLTYEYDERSRSYRPKKIFRYSDSASERLKRAKEKLESVSRCVTRMEKHVTSRKFDLDREFSNLKK